MPKARFLAERSFAPNETPREIPEPKLDSIFLDVTRAAQRRSLAWAFRLGTNTPAQQTNLRHRVGASFSAIFRVAGIGDQRVQSSSRLGSAAMTRLLAIHRD